MFLRKKVDISVGLEEFGRLAGRGVLIDVRNPSERKHGYIPGSVNMPLNQLKSAAKFIPDFDTPVYLYCANGASAERAAKRLRRAGYKNIKSIGGVEGYRGELVRE